MKKLYTLFVAIFLSNYAYSQLTPGSLDTSFNHLGYYTRLTLSPPTPGGTMTHWNKIAVAADTAGPTMAASVFRFLFSYDLGTYKLKANGTVNTAYGPYQGSNVITADSGEYVRDIVLLPNGDAIVGLNQRISVGSLADPLGWPALYKMKANGMPDSTFGGAGKIIYTNNLAYMEDLVLAGNKLYYCGTATDAGDNFMVMRFNLDGTPDNTFGTNGIALVNAGGTTNLCKSICVLPDNRIAITGGALLTDPLGADYKVCVFMLDTAGELDNSFGTNGKLHFDADSANWMADSINFEGGYGISFNNNRLVLGGATMQNGSTTLFVTHINLNGTVDGTFGNNGFWRYNAGNNIAFDYVTKLLMNVQPNGYVNLCYHDTTVTGFDVLQVNNTGILNTGFGTAGLSHITLEAADNIPQDMVFGPDSAIYITGRFAYLGNASKIFITRLLSDLTPVDTTTPTAILANQFIAQYALFPNPTNSTVRFTYELKESLPVTIKLYNSIGSLVSIFSNNQPQTIGKHSIDIPLEKQASGMYFLHILTPKGEKVLKLLKD